ncbi:MAG TPA: acyltransferase [Candidatus Baltobacteraceae bacterium]|nr:acyltransferase [Candidatus Baltobacteraceae bacterium]
MTEKSQTAVVTVRKERAASPVGAGDPRLVPSVVPAKTPKRYYRPELDSLRFFAFLAVFLFHVTPRDPSAYSRHSFLPHAVVPWICGIAGAGAFGVDLFFALSAYLITTLLLREKAERGHIDVKAFYARRILRIWPLYFLFIAIAAAIPLWDHTQKLGWPYVAGYLLLAGNWVYALKGLPASVAIPLWSISIEEQFYLFWPPILRRITRRNLVYVVMVLLAVANLARIVLIAAHASGAGIEYNTFARIDPIALGILAACLLGDRSPSFSPAMRFALVLAALAACASIGTYGHLNAPQSAAPVIGTLIGRPLVALAAAAILVASIGARGPGRILTFPGFVYLGKISYGLYVYHMAGVLIAEHILRNGHGGRHRGAALLGFLLTVAFSAISYRWFESPFLRLKDRFAVIRSRPV